MNDEQYRRQQLKKLAQGVGVSFSNLDLLDLALTHASINSDLDVNVGDYEALEFLGDAALGLAVAHHLYETVPDHTPGEYSRMRAHVVNRRGLAKVARQLNLGPHIRLGRGEERSGGRERSALLSDCLESVIGAIYLDQGWLVARDFVEHVFAEELREAQLIDEIWDYKSRLQHYCQAEHIPLPQFVLARSAGPDHLKEFEVEVYLRSRPAGRGVGKSKKEAEQNAARQALEREGKLPVIKSAN